MIEQRPIGQILREVANISEEDLEKGLQTQRSTREPLGAVLVKMGLITERDRARALCRQWGVPFIDMSEKTIDPEIVNIIPRNMIQRSRVLPLERNGNRLVVAMANPLDIFAIDQLRLITGMEIDPVITIEEELNNAIANVISASVKMEETIRRVVDDVKDQGGGDLEINESKKEDDMDISVDRLREMVDDAPIIQLVNMILRQGLLDKASDIHIQPEADKVRVRYRVDGVLSDASAVPKQAQAALVSRIKVMADMDIAEKRSAQDGRISLTLNGKDYDMRVSSLPGVKGEKIVMRILDQSGINVPLSKLGMPDKMLETWDKLIHRSYGIVLVTGPTGSGKSTTLYATLNELNAPDVNILTVEDPVEYQLAGLTQVPINRRAKATFATTLRSFLRQDPDIILVGETRDAETALISIESALTGHLVFTTLHTNDAPGAMARLSEMGVEPFLSSSAVIGVLAQSLVRGICPKCKVAYTPPMEALKRFNFTTTTDNVTFYRGTGCSFCRNTGYKGRIGVFELMAVDNELRDLMLQKAPTHILRQAALDAGMISLKQDAMNKIFEGITTMEEALRVIYAE